MKKIIGILLAVIMLAALPVSFASAEDEALFSYSQEQANKFSALGVFSDSIISKETLEGAPLTRGEFASLMTFLFSVTPDGEKLTEAPFSDVDIDEAISPYIKAAKDYLKFYGFSDGTFHPDSPILYSQAVRAILSNMGYDVKAEVYGGYPTGYMRIASELKLTSGISKGNDEELDINDYLRLIENTLDKPVLTVTSAGDSVSFGNDNNDTVLSLYHDIYFIENILNANDITSLKGYNDTEGKRVVIGNTEINAGEVSVLSLTGYDVRAYYHQKRTDSNGTLLYIEKTKDNTELSIAVEDIVKNSSLTDFTYEVSEDKKKTINITPDMQVIVNGIVKPLYGVKDIYPDDGEVVFIDNNNDSRYDIISVFAVTSTMLMGAVSEYDEKYYIFDYCDPTVSIIVKSNDSYHADVLRDGLKVDIMDLKSMDVLSIGQAPDGSVIIKATSQKFDGVISEYSDKDVTIDDKKYETSYIYDYTKTKSGFSEMEIGVNMTFYLDYTGKIVATVKEKTSMQYGMILQLKEHKEGFEHTIMLRVLATDGETYDYTLSEDVIFNGKNEKAANVYTALDTVNSYDMGRKDVRQLIMFEKPEGTVISKLNSVTPGGELTYDGSFRIVNYYDYYYSTFSHEAYVNTSTAVFYMYDSDDNCVGKLGGYSPQSLSVRDATVYFYNIDDSNLLTSVVVEHRSGGDTANQKADNSVKSYVVSGKIKTVDQDGAQVDALSLTYTDGSKASVYLSDKTNDAVKAVFDSAKTGDIVQYSTDNKGRLNGFHIKVDRDRLDDCGFGPNSENVHDYDHGSDAYSTMQFPLVSALGYVNKVVGADVFYTRGSTDTVLRRKTVSGALGLIELKKSDKDYIKVTPNIKTSDIMPGDYIFLRTNSNTLVTSWAIRELD